MKELHEVIEAGLKALGFDGLYRPGECACMIGEIIPCGEPADDCMAGYKTDADPESGYDFMIGPDKPDSEQGIQADACCDSPGLEKCQQCQEIGSANPHNH